MAFATKETFRPLVYEYMESGSLDSLLFSDHNGIKWEKPKALFPQRIIHHDIKPRNVLLDARYE